MSISYDKEDLKDLFDGRLPWDKVKSIMSNPKDDDRFDKYIEILQEGVSWPERILMPIGEHLYIVQTIQILQPSPIVKGIIVAQSLDPGAFLHEHFGKVRTYKTVRAGDEDFLVIQVHKFLVFKLYRIQC